MQQPVIPRQTAEDDVMEAWTINAQQQRAAFEAIADYMCHQ